MVWIFFFFKQKTAYERRISDWSSDVCSSDLTYQGSTITSGGNVSINASGNVSRENVKTNAEGTQTTRAGGAISDKTVKDQKDVTAVNGSLEGKSTSADTGTGSADNSCVSCILYYGLSSQASPLPFSPLVR